MFRYQGLIDFSALEIAPTGPLSVESAGEISCIKLPGIDMRWKSGFADIALIDNVVALSVGRPRLPTSGLRDAAHWIERYKRCEVRAADDVGGGFAVVILDLIKRQALLFVDRFAIETLCYRADNGRLGFTDVASNVPGSAKAIDAQSLYDYLYFHAIPAPQTVFADVCRVEGGHRVTVSSTATKAVRYWQPVFMEHNRDDLPGRLRRFVDIVRDCVREEADEPATACFLSGGTDSSTVAGMLRQLRGQPIHAYSIGFEAEGYDEMSYARIAARHFDLIHHEYYVTPEDLVRAIPKLAAAFDQPFGNSSVLPAYCCALRAKQDGFSRILAGDGGDELFGGNSRYAMQKVFNLYHKLPNMLRVAMLEPAALNWRMFRQVPGLKQLGGYVRHSRVPMPDRFHTFQLLDRLDEDTFLDPDFRASVDSQRPLSQQRVTWQEAKADSIVNRMLAYDWKYTLADNDLPKVRQATQLANITVGYPLLGRELTEFSLSLPPDWKVKGITLRWFFKRALRDFLPAEILRKKKHGFGLPFGQWALRHAGLRLLVEESLEGIAHRGIVRPGFIVELLKNRLPEAPGYYGEMVWLLLMLEQWLRANQSTPHFALVRGGRYEDPVSVPTTSCGCSVGS